MAVCLSKITTTMHMLVVDPTRSPATHLARVVDLGRAFLQPPVKADESGGAFSVMSASPESHDCRSSAVFVAVLF